jgi:hypothetical protein
LWENSQEREREKRILPHLLLSPPSLSLKRIMAEAPEATEKQQDAKVGDLCVWSPKDYLKANGTNFTAIEDKQAFQELACCVCTELLREPHVHDTCQNMMCRACIEKLPEPRACPLCVGPILLDTNTRPPPLIVRNLMAALPVRCDHCNKECRGNETDKHLADACPRPCPYTGCDPIEYASQAEWSEHVIYECIYKPVACTVASDEDCAWVGPEKDRIDHERTCPALQLRDTLRGYKRKIQELEASVSLLQQQVPAKRPAINVSAQEALLTHANITATMMNSDAFWAKQATTTCVISLPSVPVAGAKDAWVVREVVTLAGVRFQLSIKRVEPLASRPSVSRVTCSMGICASQKPLPGRATLVFRLVPWHPVCHYAYDTETMRFSVNDMLSVCRGRSIDEAVLLQCITSTKAKGGAASSSTLTLRLQVALELASS